MLYCRVSGKVSRLRVRADSDNRTRKEEEVQHSTKWQDARSNVQRPQALRPKGMKSRTKTRDGTATSREWKGYS